MPPAESLMSSTQPQTPCSATSTSRGPASHTTGDTTTVYLDLFPDGEVNDDLLCAVDEAAGRLARRLGAAVSVRTVRLDRWSVT